MTWSCCTAADPAPRRSRQVGPGRTAFTRSCAKPNWDRDGKAAPFRRNDVLLNFLPKGLVAFPGSGITNNMIDIFQNLNPV